MCPVCSLRSPVAEGCAFASTLLSSLALVRSLLSVLPPDIFTQQLRSFLGPSRGPLRLAITSVKHRANVAVCVRSKGLSCILFVLFVRWWLVLCVRRDLGFPSRWFERCCLCCPDAHAANCARSSVHREDRRLSSSKMRGAGAAACCVARGACSVSCLRSSFAGGGGLCVRGGLASLARVGSFVRLP